MLTKNILIFFPLILILFLIQSFFWVPTYENQVVDNPARLLKYIQASGGDAQILNPILSADTSSSNINDLIFEGLIDLDKELKYEPRLAKSWIQYEEAYLAVNLSWSFPGIGAVKNLDEWSSYLINILSSNVEWNENIRKIEIVDSEIFEEKFEEIEYTYKQPPKIKFTLKKINQDFFKPIRKILGNDYFIKFPYQKYIKAKNPEHQSKIESQLKNILPVIEHNPVIIFNLRNDVTFHDGHKFDSGDVLFTYKSIINPKGTSPRKSDYEPVKSAKIIGPHKIKFVYKRLFSSAIGSWTMGILPEHLLKEKILKDEARLRGRDPENFIMRDSQFGRNPIGTGPFKFRRWKSDEAIELVRNDNYWDRTPEYKDYIMRVIPDALTQEMEFYTGAVDNYSVQPHQVSRFSKENKFQSFSSIGYFYSYIGYNIRNPLFADPQIRTALGMAIDIDPIIKYLLYGEGERVTGPYPKITEWYDPDIKPLPYDPTNALKILNTLGWKINADGWLEKEGKHFEFNLITNSGNSIRKNILTIVQESWRKIGVKCNTQLFEWAVFLNDFVNPLKYDALILGWSMGTDPDLYQIWHSSQAGPNQLNFVGYKNPQVDQLITRIRKEYDRSKQVKMARELHRLIALDQPYTFLYVSKSTQVLDKNIVIVEKDDRGNKNYSKIYPTKDGRINYYFNKWKKLPRTHQFTSAG